MLVMNGDVTGDEAWVMCSGMRAAQSVGARAEEDEVMMAVETSRLSEMQKCNGKNEMSSKVQRRKVVVSVRCWTLDLITLHPLSTGYPKLLNE
jgi:hypothetical protein